MVTGKWVWHVAATGAIVTAEAPYLIISLRALEKCS